MIASRGRGSAALAAVVMVGAAMAGCASRGGPPGPACRDPYLAGLVGSWDIRREIRGTVVTNTMEVRPVLGGSFIEMHMVSTTPDRPYEALVLVGAEGGRYVAHWCDSFGPGFSAVGRGVLEGGRLELRFEYPDGPFFNTWEFFPDRDAWAFTGENSAPGGARTLFAKDTVTRRGSRVSSLRPPRPPSER